ncbi:MAG: hypothetical protein J07AB43_02340 [Candidatus Nanosalina sp. J07AB43]|nr:MAG: hypothetical protein J07AB43_02340 [Candidatus Nanosalina sp. J07AB43]
MTSTYNVLVDFSTNSRKDILEVIQGGIHKERIGDNQYQIGLGVQAETSSQAYRLAVNVVEAQLEAFTIQSYQFDNVEVYGPEDEHEVFRG